MLTLFRDRSTANLDVWSKLFVVGSLLVLGWFLAAPSLLELRLSNYEPKLRDIILWIQFVWKDSYVCNLKKTMAHLVPNGYGPRTFGPPQLVPNWLIPLNKRSPTNFVPMDKWSPNIRSPWTNGSQPIWSHWTNGPYDIPFVQGGQAVGIQKNRDQIGWGPFVQGDQIFVDHLSRGTEFDWDRLSRGINFMGIVCPGGQEVRGSNWSGTKCVAVLKKVWPHWVVVAGRVRA